MLLCNISSKSSRTGRNIGNIVSIFISAKYNLLYLTEGKKIFKISYLHKFKEESLGEGKK